MLIYSREKRQSELSNITLLMRFCYLRIGKLDSRSASCISETYTTSSQPLLFRAIPSPQFDPRQPWEGYPSLVKHLRSICSRLQVRQYGGRGIKLLRDNYSETIWIRAAWRYHEWLLFLAHISPKPKQQQKVLFSMQISGTMRGIHERRRVRNWRSASVDGSNVFTERGARRKRRLFNNIEMTDDNRVYVNNPKAMHHFR